MHSARLIEWWYDFNLGVDFQAIESTADIPENTILPTISLSCHLPVFTGSLDLERLRLLQDYMYL